MKLPLLHVIATDDVVGSPGFAQTADEILSAARNRVALHLRLRRVRGVDFQALAERMADAAGRSGAWCAVNGRLDVALVAGAQAVQLGREALPVEAARRVGGSRLAIGASVHRAEAAHARAREGADFLVAGSVFSTTTHPGSEPAGPILVTECARAGLPVVAIGGIDASNAGRVVAAGACGVAVIRAVWQEADPVEAALRLIDVVTAGLAQ